MQVMIANVKVVYYAVMHIFICSGWRPRLPQCKTLGNAYTHWFYYRRVTVTWPPPLQLHTIMVTVL
jgi:hypothetical protein